MKTNEYINDITQKPRIWLLKEEIPRANSILNTLSEIGHVNSFNRIEELIHNFKHQLAVDLVITGYRLRNKTFTDALNEWDEQHFFEKVPTLMISEMNCINTIRGLFQRGLKDYFISPISDVELRIKTENILSKNQEYNTTANYIRLGKDQITGLTKKEIQILQFLRSKENAMASRKELETYCWPKNFVTPQTLNVHIHNLRKKIKCFGHDITATNEGWELTSSDDEQITRTLLKA